MITRPPDEPARTAPRTVLRPRSARTRVLLLLPVVAATSTAILLVASAESWATELVRAAPADLNKVINNLRNVIVGLLVGLATLFATVGGLRYMLAGNDPGEVESAKKTLKYAAIGYGVAALAPGLVEILKGIVGA